MIDFKRCKKKKKIFSRLSFTCQLFSCLISIFSLYQITNGHYLVKRENPDERISPEECIEKIKEKEEKQKDVECFKIDRDLECDDHCEELGDDKCGGSRGRAYNYQCKNPQKGDKKACCCSIKCESKEETKRHLKDLYADMHDDTRGLCSSFTDSTEAWKTELKRMCSNDDRIHIARKFCLEERRGEKYFCLKIGECRGKRDETCIGCIAHECVMAGQDEGDHIVVPEEYEKERLEKQDFDKSGVGNVEDLKHMVKKDQHCTDIKCNNEGECNKRCRKYCKDHGNKNCNGNTLTYGTAVEGKQGGGKLGTNRCCCQPICSVKQADETGSRENEEITKEDRESKDEQTSRDDKYKNKDNSQEQDREDSPYDAFKDDNYSGNYRLKARNLRKEHKNDKQQQNGDQSNETSGAIKPASNENKSSEKYEIISEEENENSAENNLSKINEDEGMNSETKRQENDNDDSRKEKDEESKEERSENETKENNNSNIDIKEKETEQNNDKKSKQDEFTESNESSNQDYRNTGGSWDAYGSDESNYEK